MAELATNYQRIAHAVDSFKGMADPSPQDLGQYPKGALDVGGSAHFRMLVKPYGPMVKVHEGWVPDVLDEMARCTFAFVHLDLDHYLPTLAALEWFWPRMERGGVMACHDWFIHKCDLATRAINEWLAGNAHNSRIIDYNEHSHHLWIAKGGE
jgi:O-methyltransferase